MMDDKTAKELTRSLDKNTKALENLAKVMKKSKERKDPAKPVDTIKLKG